VIPQKIRLAKTDSQKYIMVDILLSSFPMNG